MAEIVLGIGTSHSTQCSIGPEWWETQGQLDRHRTPFDELERNAPPWLAGELRREVWERKFHEVQAAITRLAKIIDTGAPDVLVVIGDDQKELFLDDSMPVFSIFRGTEIWDLPGSPDGLSPSHLAGRWAVHADAPEAYPTDAALATHLIERLVEDSFDVSQFTRQPAGRSLGHAWTFIRRRLRADRPPIPMVPVLINTYFPPNQPSASRCHALGRALRRAIESWPAHVRVGIVASGGLSHFVVDEKLDRGIIDAMQRHDASWLSNVPASELQAGSSEILNWIAGAGALEHLTMELVAYVPGYRTVAGTGCGMTFAAWQ